MLQSDLSLSLRMNHAVEMQEEGKVNGETAAKKIV